MIADILTGLGLVAVIEGLVLALAPLRFDELQGSVDNHHVALVSTQNPPVPANFAPIGSPLSSEISVAMVDFGEIPSGRGEICRHRAKSRFLSDDSCARFHPLATNFDPRQCDVVIVHRP